MYSLYIAHDDSQTDSSKTFKATATNVGLVCFRGEVYYLHTGSGIYKKAGLALSSSVLSSPAFTETQVSMTKDIDSDGLVTTPSRSENFRADDNSLFVSWLKNDDDELTDQFEVTYNHPRINIGSEVDEVDFITRRKKPI